jgi:quercetin dioxygenase-like cupin family protein
VNTKTNEIRTVQATTTTTTQRITRRVLLIGSALALLLTTNFATQTAFATPPSGVTTTAIASGVLPEAIRVKIGMEREGFGNGTEATDLSIIKNTFVPGGTFGWHRHPGPSLVMITQGTLTLYEAGDPTCTPHLYPAGSAFIDNAGDAHNVRNETAGTVEVYVVRMLPAGAPPRIDMPDPGVCPF